MFLSCLIISQKGYLWVKNSKACKKIEMTHFLNISYFSTKVTLYVYRTTVGNQFSLFFVFLSTDEAEDQKSRGVETSSSKSEEVKAEVKPDKTDSDHAERCEY